LSCEVNATPAGRAPRSLGKPAPFVGPRSQLRILEAVLDEALTEPSARRAPSPRPRAWAEPALSRALSSRRR
jgi:hypothetical protein